MPYDFAKQSFVNQFITACNDRTFAAGTFANLAGRSVGDDVQSASFWGSSALGGLQQRVESVVTRFVDNTFAQGTPVVFGGFNGTTPTNTPDTLFTLAAWRAKAGINASGFRRMTSTGATAYGYMQAGDVIGDWIFDELAAGLRLLTCTRATGNYHGTTVATNRFIRRVVGSNAAALGQSPSTYTGGVGNDSSPSWTLADSRRDANYTSSLQATTATTQPNNAGFSADRRTTWNGTRTPQVEYDSSYLLAIPVDNVASMSATVSKRVEFWVATRSALPSDSYLTWTFDANGFNVTEGCWSILETVNAGLSGSATMTDPGHITPAAASTPPDAVDLHDTGRWRGFDLGNTNTYVIIRWTFTDPPV